MFVAYGGNTLAGIKRRAAEGRKAVPAIQDQTPVRRAPAGRLPAVNVLRAYPVHPTPVKTLICMIAFWHGCTVEDMKGAEKTRELVAARHDAVVTLKKFRPHWSLARIGRELNLHHTTVLNAIRKRRGRA